MKKFGAVACARPPHTAACGAAAALGSQLPTAAWAAGPRRINLKVWLSAQLEVLAIHFSICQCPGPLASPTESVVRTAAAAGVIVIMWRPGFTLKLP